MAASDLQGNSFQGALPFLLRSGLVVQLSSALPYCPIVPSLVCCFQVEDEWINHSAKIERLRVSGAMMQKSIGTINSCVPPPKFFMEEWR